jgi:hypothetical protein
MWDASHSLRYAKREARKANCIKKQTTDLAYNQLVDGIQNKPLALLNNTTMLASCKQIHLSHTATRMSLGCSDSFVST